MIYMTPQGRVFNQSIAQDLAKEEDLVFYADIMKVLMREPWS